MKILQSAKCETAFIKGGRLGKYKKKKFQFYARFSDFDIWLGGRVFLHTKEIIAIDVRYKFYQNL